MEQATGARINEPLIKQALPINSIGGRCAALEH